MNYRLRFAILERDRFRCRYCGIRAVAAELQVDHVVPVSRGGRDHPDNLVAACVPCNQGKKARLLADPTTIGLAARRRLPDYARRQNVGMVHVSSALHSWYDRVLEGRP